MTRTLLLIFLTLFFLPAAPSMADDSPYIIFTAEERGRFTKWITDVFVYLKTNVAAIEPYKDRVNLVDLEVVHAGNNSISIAPVNQRFKLSVPFGAYRTAINLAMVLSAGKKIATVQDITCVRRFIDYGKTFSGVRDPSPRLPPRIDLYLAASCPTVSQSIFASTNALSDKELYDSAQMVLSIWMLHELGHVVLKHTDAAFSKEAELNADGFSAFHLMRIYNQDYDKIFAHILALFMFTSGTTFHSAGDIGAHPPVGERLAQMGHAMIDYAKWMKDEDLEKRTRAYLLATMKEIDFASK